MNTADSIAHARRIDSIAGSIHPVKLERKVNPLDTASAPLANPPAYTAGLEPAPRPYNPTANSVLPASFVVIILLLAFSFRQLLRLIQSSAKDVWSIRRRENLFDEHTASESRVGAILVLAMCLSMAVLAYFGICRHFSLPHAHASREVLVTLAVFAVYFLFQLGVYSLIGFTFARDPGGARQWIKGFLALCYFQGLFMLVPALVCLFFPEYAEQCVGCGLFMFVVAKLVFICKGFRIFSIIYSRGCILFCTFAAWK